MRMFPRLPLAGAALSSVLLLSACVDLAPAYTRPDAPVAPAWPAPAPAPAQAPASAPARDAADIGWHDVVLDERLRRVIEMALANNRDLRASVLNVEQARAQYRIQDATSLPAVAAGASFTRTRAPEFVYTATSSVSIRGTAFSPEPTTESRTDPSLSERAETSSSEPCCA